MKTTTLTIRLSANDKALFQNAAKARNLTVTEYLIELVRADKGGYAINETAATLEEVKAELADLRDQVTALARPKASGHGPDPALPPELPDDPNEYFDPGFGPDCNYSCRWFTTPFKCKHEETKDRSIAGDCPYYDPKE